MALPGHLVTPKWRSWGGYCKLVGKGVPPKTELLSCPRVKLQREGQSFVGLAKIHFSDCAQKRFVRFCFGSQSSPSASHIGERLPRLWLPCAFSQRQAALSIYPALTGITWHLRIQRPHARLNSVWYFNSLGESSGPGTSVTAVTQEGGTGAQPAREDRLAKDKRLPLPSRSGTKGPERCLPHSKPLPHVHRVSDAEVARFCCL
jgi:hypothetical protein